MQVNGLFTLLPTLGIMELQKKKERKRKKTFKNVNFKITYTPSDLSNH